MNRACSGPAAGFRVFGVLHYSGDRIPVRLYVTVQSALSRILLSQYSAPDYLSSLMFAYSCREKRFPTQFLTKPVPDPDSLEKDAGGSEYCH